MGIFDRVMKWVMIGSGLLTCTLVTAAFAPEMALMSAFGESMSGPLADTVVRNWGILITLIGLFLIYGAFVPSSRKPALLMAAASKAAFVSLVLAAGDRYMPKAMGPVVIDSVLVVVYLAYVLTSSRRRQPEPAPD